MRTTVGTTALVIAGLALAACGGSDGSASAAACDGEIAEDTTVTVWAHEGQEADIYTQLVDDFNTGPGSEQGITVDLTLIPEGQYTDQVKSAAAAGDLPDVLDFDGPTMANFAWGGAMTAIDECAPDEVVDNMLPSLVEQGTYADRLWGLGSFDSGLGLYAWKSALEEVDARIPEGADDAWTTEELEQIMVDLQAAGYESPLDTKFWYGAQGEWFTYGYSPILWSAGGGMVDIDGDLTAEDVINGQASVDALTTFQSWVDQDLVDTDAVDDSNFLNGDAPISWVGHWMYAPYSEALGDDLVLLPLPDFGDGTRTGMGSWAWGMGAGVEEPDAAWAVIDYFLSDDVVLAITDVNGAVPGTNTAIDKSELYADGGALRLYVDQLEAAPDVAHPRPVTPAYPTITSAFASSLDDIIQGADVQETMDEAAATIDSDIEDNSGYPAPE